MNGDFQIGEWRIQPSLNTVSRNGASTRLEPKVMEVLVFLAEHTGEVIPKETLLQRVWPNTFVTDDVLKRSISELRRVFNDDAHESQIIATIPKRGYRLLAVVEPINGELAARRSVAARVKRGWRLVSVAGVGLFLLCGLLVGFNVADIRAHIFRPNPPIRSLAVLPLKNLSDDPSQKYFASGMTEELITDLSQVGALRVISRTSSEVYENTHKTLPEIARELNVDAVIEGSVERFGNRVRVTAQLIYAPEDRNLWAHSYDRDLQDVLLLQGTIANDIAGRVRIHVAPSEQTHLNAPRAVKASVLEAYLEGNYHLHLVGRGTVDEEDRMAAQYFQRAIDEDPTFAPAYIGLAKVGSSLIGGKRLMNPSSRDYEARKAAVEKAVQLNPDSWEAHDLLASLYCEDWKWSRAEEELQRAIALNPNSADAHDSYSGFLIGTGRGDEGMREAEIAQSLDPNVDHLASALYNLGRNNEAIALMLRDVVRDPDNSDLHSSLFLMYASAGRYPEAIKEFEVTGKLLGFGELMPAVDHAYKTASFDAAIRIVTTNFEKLHRERKLYAPGMLAALYSVVGDKDRAFYWLEDAYRHKHSTGADGGFLWFKGEPSYVSLRSDPRFADLVRRVGLRQ